MSYISYGCWENYIGIRDHHGEPQDIPAILEIGKLYIEGKRIEDDMESLTIFDCLNGVETEEEEKRIMGELRKFLTGFAQTVQLVICSYFVNPLLESNG